MNLTSGLTPDTSGYANSSYGLVSTFAGSGSKGSTDGTGTAASFSNPFGVAVDGSGNVYVADYFNNKIRKITPGGVVTTFAGSGSFGSTDGIGTVARFSGPTGVAVDGSSNVYVADQGNHKIRKITPAGIVSTLAGSGSEGSADSAGAAASFHYPTGVAVDAGGYVYVADAGNNKIRKITPAGVVTTFASSGSFNYPAGVAVDAGGNVYVADEFNSTIRKMTPAGVVTTLAGSEFLSGSNDGTGGAARFNFPIGVAVDAGGNVYVADAENDEIRKITPAGVVTTLAGNGSSGSTNATGAAASFSDPKGVAVDAGGNLYVGDYSNNEIRKILTTANFVTNTSLSTVLNNYATTASLSGYATLINTRSTLHDSLSGYATIINTQSTLHDSLSGYVSVLTDQTVSGVKSFATGIALASSGGTPSVLNYYDEDTLSVSLTNAAITVVYNTGYIVKALRVGNKVTLTFVSDVTNLTITNGGIDIKVANIPSQFRPSTGQYFTVLIRNGGTDGVGLAFVRTGGDVLIKPSATTNSGNWNGTGNCGFYAFSVSYVVQ